MLIQVSLTRLMAQGWAADGIRATCVSPGVVTGLLGPEAGYVTGQNLVADGGLSDSILRLLPRREK